VKNKNGLDKPAAGVVDRDLIKACCRREPGAWEGFLEQYSKLIYYSIHRTCKLRHYTISKEEVEDMFNDVLVHFIRDDCKRLRLFRGEGGCSAATWIRTVTVRYVIDYLRQQSRIKGLVSIEDEKFVAEVSMESPVTRPDEIYELREDERIFDEAVDSLAENDKYFMELYYTRGLPPDEVSQVLGISVKTVYSRVNRIKTKIQQAVENFGRK
jgi:RNA polymerase sigma-70 factor (ECF subfamily)